jgi:hypothetical protein
MPTRRHLGAAAPLLASLALGLSDCGGSTSPAASVSVRTCSEVGSGGLAADYRERALVLGPLALSNVPTYEASQPLPGHVGKRYGAYEIIAVVRHGAKVARLEACKSASFNHGVSQFDGGFVVTRPQCVHFTVTAGGRTYASEFPAAAACKGWRPVPAIA